MLLHVAVSYTVRHTLIAEGVDQPIEYRGRVVPLHRGDYAVPRQTDPGVVDEAPAAGNSADTANEPDYRPQARWLGCRNTAILSHCRKRSC